MLLETDIHLVPISLEILMKAANVRAKNPAIRTPDAIHLATAVVERCSVFITNDVGLKHVSDIPTIILNELLP